MPQQQATPTVERSGRDALRYMCRHLVALCVWYVRRGSAGDARFAAYSGTLIRIRGATCLLTAGHVLRDLEAAMDDASVEIKGASLADTFGLGAVTDHPIPFDLRAARASFFHVVDDAAGLDFGVVPLDPHHVGLLRRHDMVAMGEENWLHQHRVAFDGYAMLGLPEQFTSERLDDSGAGVVSPTFISLRRLDPPPGDLRATTYPRFVGQIDPKLDIDSVVGMSGGPIFGFRRNHELRYWVVAIQSSWLASRGIVFGCSVPVIASIIAEQQAPAA